MTWGIFYGVLFILAIIGLIDGIREQGRKLRIEEQQLEDWYRKYRK